MIIINISSGYHTHINTPKRSLHSTKQELELVASGCTPALHDGTQLAKAVLVQGVGVLLELHANTSAADASGTAAGSVGINIMFGVADTTEESLNQIVMMPQVPRLQNNIANNWCCVKLCLK